MTRLLNIIIHDHADKIIMEVRRCDSTPEFFNAYVSATDKSRDEISAALQRAVVAFLLPHLRARVGDQVEASIDGVTFERT